MNLQANVASQNYACTRQSQSGRGQPHSKTLRDFESLGARVSVLECGCPLPLFSPRERQW